MTSLISDISRFGRFSASVWRLLGDPLTAEIARERIQRALELRECTFLENVEGILANPQGPYARLLEHAGIEYGDVAALVREHGLEGALGRLYDAGIYTTPAEFKGDTPIRRGSLEFRARHSDFRNELVPSNLAYRTGGSGGRPRTMIANIESSGRSASHVMLCLDAFGLEPRPMAIWYPAPPSPAGLMAAITHVRAGWRVEHWFAQTHWMERGFATSSSIVLGAHAISRARRRPIPFPRYTPAEQAARVAQWLSAKKRVGTPGLLAVTASGAVRAVNAANELGLDIAGTVFRCGGEALTPAKEKVIEDAGCSVFCYYHVTDAAGLIGVPCGRRVAVDEVHLASDRVAAISRRRKLFDGEEVDALLLTTVLPRVPTPLINWESGDTAVLEERSCGCTLDEAGLRPHLHTIRSYEKLTSEGMTFSNSALVTLVEEQLPRRFGGSPNDYQFVEQEVGGTTRMRLRASPQLGPLDEDEVRDEAVRFLASRGGEERFMAMIWRLAGTIEVVRVEPHVTRAGKTPALWRARGVTD
jgi:hypothetical protein